MTSWILPNPHPIIETIGWVLLHFLWQGALIALAFGIARFLLLRRSPNSRYIAGCVAMLLLVSAPVVTFAVLSNPKPTTATMTAAAEPVSTRQTATPEPQASSSPARQFVALPETFGTESSYPGFQLRSSLPWIVVFWTTGVFFLSLRLGFSWMYSRRLRTREVQPVDDDWQARLEELQRRLAVSRPVQLLQSGLVQVPSVIGWLRPVILIPASSFTGLTPSQLESILAHELAHIRRHDYLVNLCQSLAETLLFYHPAVWWISRSIREEREICCDDIAVGTTHEPATYAAALAALEELRHLQPNFALRATGPGLLPRIRRILGLTESERPQRARLTACMVGFLAVVLGALPVYGILDREQEYFGEPIDVWIEKLDTSYRYVAEDVLASIGQDVVPYLDEVLRNEDQRYSPRTRQSAAALVERLGSDGEALVPALIEVLKDGPHRTAVRSLGRLRAAAAPAVPFMIPMLDDPDPDVRRTVADALGWIGPGAAEAVPALAALLKDPDAGVRTFAAQSLGMIHQNPEVAVPALIQAARDGGALTEVHAVQSVGRYGPAASAAIPMLAEQMSTADDPDRVRRALRALARIGSFPEQLEPLLREIMQGEDALSACWATVLLWKNDSDNPELKSEVLRYITGQDPVVQSTPVLSLLATMDSPPQYLEPVLTDLLDAPHHGIRRWAAHTLVRIEPARKETLSHHIKPRSAWPWGAPLDPAETRVINILVENDFEADRILPQLLQFSESPGTMEAVTQGLVAISGDNPAPILAPLLQYERARVQIAALGAFNDLGITLDADPILVDLLQHADESVRIAAAEQLGFFVSSDASPELIAALEKAATDPNERIQTLAIQTLNRIQERR